MSSSALQLPPPQMRRWLTHVVRIGTTSVCLERSSHTLTNAFCRTLYLPALTPSGETRTSPAQGSPRVSRTPFTPACARARVNATTDSTLASRTRSPSLEACLDRHLQAYVFQLSKTSTRVLFTYRVLPRAKSPWTSGEATEFTPGSFASAGTPQSARGVIGLTPSGATEPLEFRRPCAPQLE
jgi:hypothetical protein